MRGVQESDADGKLTFADDLPGRLPGRWPHMHFEIYESLDAAAPAARSSRTSQLAVPKAVCDEVYTTAGYEQSVQNLAQTSLEGDMVFSDGYRSQLATASGSASDTIALALNVGV